MKTEKIPFAEALRISESYGKRHLLLGNGFSIACVPSIFTYRSLFDEADFSAKPQLAKTFAQLNTHDFELVIRALEYSSLTIPAYDSSLTGLCGSMSGHASELKEILVSTIAKTHPEFPSKIEESNYLNCIKFLNNFLQNGGRVYSVNYDLLLYWTLMFGLGRSVLAAEPNDGFGKNWKEGYLAWQGETTAHGQNIHYMHGALHLFDRGHSVEKFNWTDAGIPLIEQARKALTEKRFPLFVAESASDKKMEKITHSGYLYHSYKSFSSTMTTRASSGCCLFTFGFSFNENDQHISTKISNGTVNHLFVGLHGNLDSPSTSATVKAVEIVKRQRDGSLEVTYYDASSANVWK